MRSIAAVVLPAPKGPLKNRVLESKIDSPVTYPVLSAEKSGLSVVVGFFCRCGELGKTTGLDDALSPAALQAERMEP